MLIKDGEKITKPVNVTLGENANEGEILAFLQGAVYCWCNTNGTEKFAAKSFVGDKNWDWHGTPLQQIYDHYAETKNEAEAYKQSGIAVGLLLEKVLIEDVRQFNRETIQGERSAEYQWDGKYEPKN